MRQSFLTNQVKPAQKKDQLMNCHVSQSIQAIFIISMLSFWVHQWQLRLVGAHACSSNCADSTLRSKEWHDNFERYLPAQIIRYHLLFGPPQLWSQSHLEPHGWSHSGEGRRKSDLYSSDIRLIFQECQAWDICGFRCLTYFNQKINWSTGRLSLMHLQQGMGNCKIILAFCWLHGRQYPRFLGDRLHPIQEAGRQC